MGQIGTTAILAVLAGACADHSAGAANRSSDEKELNMTQNGNDQGAAARQLPFAHGRSFATLDDYLAHLRDYAGPVGQPWYRKVGADTYELVTTGTPRGEPQVFTRAELLQRFGFSR